MDVKADSNKCNQMTYGGFPVILEEHSKYISPIKYIDVFVLNFPSASVACRVERWTASPKVVCSIPANVS